MQKGTIGTGLQIVSSEEYGGYPMYPSMLVFWRLADTVIHTHTHTQL